MKYYQVGVVKYSPRMLEGCVADYSVHYKEGDIIPIITLWVEDKYMGEDGFVKYIREEHETWIENTIKGLKPGDPVIFNMITNEIYKITVDSRGVGIWEK